MQFSLNQIECQLFHMNMEHMHAFKKKKTETNKNILIKLKELLRIYYFHFFCFLFLFCINIACKREIRDVLWLGIQKRQKNERKKKEKEINDWNVHSQYIFRHCSRSLNTSSRQKKWKMLSRGEKEKKKKNQREWSRPHVHQKKKKINKCHRQIILWESFVETSSNRRRKMNAEQKNFFFFDNHN